MLRLSQGQLTLLEYCPRRFQYAVLETLTVPPSAAMLAAQQWGDRFHLVMQQREMGLPVTPLLAQDAEMQRCLQTLQARFPDLFQGDERFRQSEHGRSLRFNGYWITVVYDLLRLWPDRGEIIDWKTYQQPRDQAFLQQDWQTRLYLYGLVETTDLSPEQVAMVYYFVRTRDRETDEPAPQQVRIAYSAQQHAQTHQALLHWTDQLTHWLQQNAPLPQVPPSSDRCQHCPFAVRCQRGAASPNATADLPAFEAIEELPL